MIPRSRACRTSGRSGMDNERTCSRRVVLGLGSNLGDREAAIARRAARGSTRAASRDAEELALPDRAGRRAAAGLVRERGRDGETALTPEALLAACLAVEQELGRVRGASRTGRARSTSTCCSSATCALRAGRLRSSRTRGCTSGASCSCRSPRSLPERVHPVLGRTLRELLDALPGHVAGRAASAGGGRA